MKVYDPRDVRVVFNGVPLDPDTSPRCRSTAARVGAEFTGDPADLETLLAWMKAVRAPTRIEAPSEVIAALERQLPPVEHRDPFDPLHMLPIERDDTLPAATVRVHYNDGTDELVWLERR